MKIVNCTWEKENLDENVCEVLVENKDIFERYKFLSLDTDYSYQVVKVPTNKIDFNYGLSEIGFVLIETQISWKIVPQRFDVGNELLSRFLPEISFLDIESPDELQNLLGNIDVGMFSTDRIACDKKYGLEVSRQRYCNWIHNSFRKEGVFLSQIVLSGITVGFLMLKVQNMRCYGLLGGIYKQYQDNGLGILTASSFLLYIREKKLNVKMYETSTSSNNISNFKFYNMLGFDLGAMSYVFVKHI